MMVMDYDPSSGKLTYKGQTASTLPPGFTGTNYGSGIYISPDGNFLYGLNRLYDTIVPSCQPRRLAPESKMDMDSRQLSARVGSRAQRKFYVRSSRSSQK